MVLPLEFKFLTKQQAFSFCFLGVSWSFRVSSSTLFVSSNRFLLRFAAPYNRFKWVHLLSITIIEAYKSSQSITYAPQFVNGIYIPFS